MSEQSTEHRTLVSPKNLSTHLDDPTWRIFDCRHDLADPSAGEQAYRRGHIPGAQFLSIDRDLSGAKNGYNGRHPLPEPATLAATLARHGVSNDTQVVAYDDIGGMFASRLWWLLRWLGHYRAAVLDGGLPAWQREGLPTTDRVATPTPATFQWQLSEKIADAHFIEQHLGKPSMLILDARAPDRFRGENETLDAVGGHIPGAANRFFKDNLDTDGRFKTAATLRQEFERALNGHPPASIVNQCGSGVTACHNLLALEIAGLYGARLYPGSWSEWSSDPRRPIVKGT